MFLFRVVYLLGCAPSYFLWTVFKVTLNGPPTACAESLTRMPDWY